MASESSAEFHHHQQGVLFNSAGAARSSSVGGGSGGCELISTANCYRNSMGSWNLSGIDGPPPRRRGMVFSSVGARQNSVDSSSSSLVVDLAPGMKHDTGLAADWSIDEQYKLEEGLTKYANEPNVLRYIKIASSLRDKTVRDVALRCRYMTRKRRKQEDRSFVKQMRDQKEQMELSLKNNMSPASSVNVDPYCSTTNHHDQTDCMLSGVLSGKARHLLEENNQAFGQISVNLSTLKLQQNLDLLFRTRNNIITILNDMRKMPGIMSRMPPLPVLLHEELASSIFPLSFQPMMFSASNVTPLKQEPRC
ncbi:hypothetical protein ABFS83_05G056800 [Erythranthe nasuta]